MGNKLHGMAETDLNEKIQAVLDENRRWLYIGLPVRKSYI